MDRIFAVGIPQKDDFLLIFLMNALSVEFPALSDHIADCVIARNIADPYTSVHALRRLEMEQQILDSEKQRQGVVALATTTGGPKAYNKHSRKCTTCSQMGHDICCTNCGGTGHSHDQCWRPGGGRAGDRDVILAEKRNAKAAKGKVTPTTTTTPGPTTPGLRYDTSGRAYILDGATGEAVFVAHAAAPSPGPRGKGNSRVTRG